LHASVKISNFGACIRYHNLSEMNRAYVRSWNHTLDLKVRFFGVTTVFYNSQKPIPEFSVFPAKEWKNCTVVGHDRVDFL